MRMGEKLRKILRWIRHQLYIRRFLLYLLAGIAVAVFGLVKLIGYFGDMFSSRNTNEGIREMDQQTDKGDKDIQA